MDLGYFREKLKELHEKSSMDAFLDWPFVYDEDEAGKIYVDDNGVFWFADRCSNWVESPLLLRDVVNLRYTKAFEEPGIDNDEDEPSESSIWIHFLSGEYIWLWNRHDTYSVDIDVHLHRNDTNTSTVDKLLAISNNNLRINAK